MHAHSLTHLDDDVLLRDLSSLVARERHLSVELLAHLAEVEERKLYLSAAYPSMHAYCIGALRLSEDAAYKRIRVAREARRYPSIFGALADGRLNSTLVLVLAPHLTPVNALELIQAACGRSKSGLERWLATRVAGADPAANAGNQLAPERVRGTLAPVVTESADASTAPLAPETVGAGSSGGPEQSASPRPCPLQVGFSAAALDKLKYATALLGHAVPSGESAEVLERALDALIERIEKRRFAVGARSRAGAARHSPSGRHIPAAVRREVFIRDGGRCAFESASGHRCGSETRLEFDHVKPVAAGGLTTADNLRLLCRAHNQHAAGRSLGSEFMRHKRLQARKARAETRAARESGRVRDSRRAAASRPDASASEAPESVIPWLRALGFRPDEARRGAEACDSMAGAPLEARVKRALSVLDRVGVRRTPTQPSPPPYIRNTPNLGSGMGALRQADNDSASTSRVLAGSMMPSSHRRAVEKYGLPSRS